MSRTPRRAGGLPLPVASRILFSSPADAAAEVRAQLSAIRDMQLTLNLLASHVSAATDAHATAALELARLAAMLRLLNEALAERLAAAEAVLMG